MERVTPFIKYLGVTRTPRIRALTVCGRAKSTGFGSEKDLDTAQR